MDLVVRCESLPTPGQTIVASDFREICGGKGANQAVAAARAGGDVTMIGRVGDDLFSGRLIDNLRRNQVRCDLIGSTENCSSGLAIVAVESGGENSIVVIPGANSKLTADDIYEQRDQIEASDIVLVQLEIPIDAVSVAIRIANEAGVRVMLDPAPAPANWSESFSCVDLMCPNETEASATTRSAVETIEQAESAACQLHRQGSKHVVITRGEHGVLLYDGEGIFKSKPIQVNAIDSTGAGDAFAGALAVRWAETDDIRDAIPFACTAGAIAASREGAQPGMPTRTEIKERLKTET